MNTFGWTGWDIVERATRHTVREDADQGPDAIPLSSGVVSTALLVEMQRPPWWREIDAQRKALAKEIA